MEPVEKPRLTREERLAAVEEMKRHWATQKHITIGPWTREELYERD